MRYFGYTTKVIQLMLRAFDFCSSFYNIFIIRIAIVHELNSKPHEPIANGRESLEYKIFNKLV